MNFIKCHPKGSNFNTTQLKCVHSYPVQSILFPHSPHPKLQNLSVDKPLFVSPAKFPIQSEMGLLWWKSKGKSEEKATQKPDPKPTEVPGMNGAVEVPRRPPSDVTVFEFGSVANAADKVTLAGYCPISDELEPCRWEILPAKDSDAPLFRIVFWNFFTFLLFWCFEAEYLKRFVSSVCVVISLFWVDDFEWNIQQGEKCLVGSSVRIWGICLWTNWNVCYTWNFHLCLMFRIEMRDLPGWVWKRYFYLFF